MDNTTAHLLNNCRKGNQAAQFALYGQYARWLYNACFRITGNVADAEEAMQDAFIKIFKQVNQYTEGQSFEAWMHRIATRSAIDYLRKRDPKWEEISDNYTIAEEEEEPNEEDVNYTLESVKNAMSQLPAGYRAILSLYLFEGYDAEEIASILNIKPPSVRSQYLRAKRKLLDIIKKNNG